MKVEGEGSPQSRIARVQEEAALATETPRAPKRTFEEVESAEKGEAAQSNIRRSLTLESEGAGSTPKVRGLAVRGPDGRLKRAGPLYNIME